MSSNHKFESNKKYFTISIYTIAVILIGCVIFRFITQWSNTSKLISQLWEILFPFFMGFLIAESSLKINEYNRVIKDLNGHSKKQFLKLLQNHFLIEPGN